MATFLHKISNFNETKSEFSVCREKFFYGVFFEWDCEITVKDFS